MRMILSLLAMCWESSDTVKFLQSYKIPTVLFLWPHNLNFRNDGIWFGNFPRSIPKIRENSNFWQTSSSTEKSGNSARKIGPNEIPGMKFLKVLVYLGCPCALKFQKVLLYSPLDFSSNPNQKFWSNGIRLRPPPGSTRCEMTLHMGCAIALP